ncbi:MAG: MerC domain-containing protein [Hyphomonadaceae bacterium JAD_PAG50586_4]|nr:MAG: MerC domain-containing protein [Hyphomonadaceae bacterium JAD_PAG50586_4]
MDATALGLSTLCILHCLGLPLLAAALPLAVGLAEAEWVHWLLVALAAPAALIAIAPSLAQRPIPWRIPTLAVLGLSGLGSALFVSSETWETALSVSGALVLATAHILNWRHAHRRAHPARGLSRSTELS